MLLAKLAGNWALAVTTSTVRSVPVETVLGAPKLALRLSGAADRL
jgi:hypothetical protein